MDDVCEKLSWSETAPREARGLLAAYLAGPDSDGLLRDAQLLVSELVTNALCHAGGPIELRASCTDEVVRVEVRDTSSVMPLLRAPNGGGRGLHIVAAIATRWGASRDDRGGKVTWFELARPRSGGDL
jgi:anti-sigma regulatory factor (Ser/Thr protein kinase)